MGTEDLLFGCHFFVTMATSHLMTGRHVSIFGLNSLIFILSISEFSFNLCHIMEMILPDILKW